MRLTPPLQTTLVKALAYIQDDEWLEVTPKSTRLRKARPERPEARGAGAYTESANVRFKVGFFRRLGAIL